MGHPKICATARGHRCTCQSCKGTQHGRGMLDKAAPDRTAERRQFQIEADEEWAASLPGKDRLGRRRSAPVRHRRAAADLARADLLSGLAQDPVTGGAARRASDVLADPECLESTPDSFAPGGGKTGARLDGRRLPTEVHFWCELIARLGDAGTEDPLTELSFDPDPAQPSDEEVSAAADLAAATFHGALAGAGLGAVPLANPLRVLALLMCPDPAWHRSLIGTAVDPLPKRLVTETTRGRLRSAFSPKTPVEEIGQLALFDLEAG